jgi:hypothetical protein
MQVMAPTMAPLASRMVVTLAPTTVERTQSLTTTLLPLKAPLFVSAVPLPLWLLLPLSLHWRFKFIFRNIILIHWFSTSHDVHFSAALQVDEMHRQHSDGFHDERVFG